MASATLPPVCPLAAPKLLSFSAQNRSLSVRGSPAIRASSIVVLPETSSQQCNAVEFDLFACPVCYEPLIRKGPPGLKVPAIYRSGFKCQKCNKTFSSKEFYLDLTVTSGTKNYAEIKPTRTELFRSPLVSFLYERGWRQNFNRSGFPGPDEEFRMAQEYFRPAEGGVLVDASCGSGLFSRKFAKSGKYAGVVALDFSENMLRQCYDFIVKEGALSSTNLALVRADVSRLPFPSGSIDAVHAGAALHCWPSPSNAVAEISRILRSGGVFVGTTFLANIFGDSISAGIVKSLRQIARLTNSTTYNNLTKGEIEDLCTTCGLTNYESKIQQAFIMFSAQKP
ncbi:hypothetical protein Scep_023926 [Stephania cephalantha]|uniref:Methyltransferase type 11 domain-containing protein n=1 Tax=Stephania cephalantha TaxID=152367 RepID=A0AAP0EWP2_9MAGN